MPSPRISLIFIINGQDVVEEVQPNQLLRAARNKALARSGNTGRPPDEWEVRDASGNLLDVSRKIKELGLEAGARLFVTVQVGAGG